MYLPFVTFGEAAAFDLEVEVSCRCRRRVAIDGLSDAFHDRRIGDTRFVCTTILPHGDRCTATPSIYIRKRGRAGWTLRDHARAMRARQPSCSPPAARSTFRTIVQQGEVAHLYDQGCPLPYTIAAIELDEPPWDRFLDRPVGRFVCPACRKGLIMHLHYGPGSPATERRRASGVSNYL